MIIAAIGGNWTAWIAPIVGASFMRSARPPEADWMATLGLIVLLVALPIGAVLLWRWWRRRTGEDDAVGRSKDTTCGSCGYPVRGLSTFHCPECGSDLRDVGIVSSSAAGSGLIWNLLAWTFMWGVLLGAAAGFLDVIVGFNEPWLAIAWGWSGVIWAGGILYALRPRPRARQLRERVSEPSDHGSASPQPATAATRNLSIMFIDVEGFTGLAAASSRDGLLGVIRRARELVTPQIARHHGRIVKTMGDGFLVTFDSPTDAVLAGRDVQAEAARRAAGAPGAPGAGDQALRFRIGITTGEVALEDNDVYGDPVNLASRIQQLAEPGQVYFSEATYHAMTRSEVPHEAIGEFELKGIVGAVRVYRVTIGKDPR